MKDGGVLKGTMFINNLAFFEVREVAGAQKRPMKDAVFLATRCFWILNLSFARLPEWSNGMGLGPIGLVPTQVRILCLAYELAKTSKITLLEQIP